MLNKTIKSEKDVYPLFPQSIQQVHDYAKLSIANAQQELDRLINIATEKRSFENTAKALDNAGGDFGTISQTIFALEMIHPDKDFRDACHEEVIKLQEFAVDAFTNKKVYKAFKDYVEGNALKETLNDEEKYYLEQTMRDFKREGLDLPDDKFEEVKALKKELATLCLNFDMNINQDKSQIEVPEKDLDGIDEDFKKNIKRNAKGDCILLTDTPTYTEILAYCKNEQTRKKFFFAYSNRAYPANQKLLETIIAKRDELAKQLGFDSYAALDIDNTMVHTEKRARDFITELAGNVKKKADQELKQWMAELPEGIKLDSKNRFNAWDLGFVKAAYKKKHFSIDDREVAQYFEADKTIQGIFDIYQRFLNLEFRILKPSWSWHEDVQLIEVHDKAAKSLMGYIFIDLHPRPNKYSHACHAGLVSTTKKINPDGSLSRTPSMSVVIANFPKATADRPALLKHSDVETFFHEFGHAMHAVLGATEMDSFAGTSVKIDFVEMPSQIFEEWMFDKKLLKDLTAHYKTGQPLTDELIDKIIELKKYDSGFFVSRQCFLSMAALDFYKAGAKKDVHKLWVENSQLFTPQIRTEPDTHYYCGFGHLTGYGSRYYGYLWSRVFALDLFYAIKAQAPDALVNPKVGKRFVDTILSKGGSQDPNILLQNYLGREPEQDAFFKDLGIEIEQ